MKSLFYLLISSVLMTGCKEDKVVNDPLAQQGLNKDTFLIEVDQMPMPEGGMQALLSALIYPAEAKEKNIQGKVMVQAYIDENGDVVAAEVIKGADPLLDKAALDAVRDVKFTPGYKDKKSVKTQIAIPIVFKTDIEGKKDLQVKKEGNYYSEPQQMPEIIGGVAAILKDFVYPEAERKAGNQGKVYVKLFIDEKGNIEKKEIEKGLNKNLDKAALDAFNNIKFTPGYVDGKAVKTVMVVPIMFKLQ